MAWQSQHLQDAVVVDEDSFFEEMLPRRDLICLPPLEFG